MLFSLRKNGGYIHSNLGGRSVLVVRKAGRLAEKNLMEFSIFCNLAYNACLNTFLGLIAKGVPIDIGLDLGGILQDCFLGHIYPYY